MVLSERRAWFVSHVTASECRPKKVLDSGEDQVHLLELFTSEGCSSCPPAEKWLNSLMDHKDLYSKFVPLAFHVTYWDYIGHKDPYAQKAFTQRQRNYSAEWGSRTIYTPGFVYNGKEWRPLVKKISPEKTKAKGRLVARRVGNETYEVQYSHAGNFTLNTALLVHGLESRVKRGENAGKKLFHHFVVSSLLQQDFNQKGRVKVASSDDKLKKQSIVFWVSPQNSQIPLQVVAGCL